MENEAKRKEGPPVPTVSLPKGGGAIHGIGEKFAANPLTGTGAISVPVAVSPGRAGFGPQLSLSYDSGNGNSPFGFGWNLSLPSITRKTSKGLPRYTDSDVFLAAGAEDLIPVLGPDDQPLADDRMPGYRIYPYYQRVEGLFARIERWERQTDGDVHWRSFSADNVLTVFGSDENSRLTDPADPRRIYSWLISETRDDKGNAVLYEYKSEDGQGVDLSQAHERNRGSREDGRRKTNRYLRRIRYGNRLSLLDANSQRPHLLTPDQIEEAGWMFEVRFDYGEHADENPSPNDAGEWVCRPDPFSTYRPGFELRTYRLCRRVLMFHHFPEAPDEVGLNCLVRSTNIQYATTLADSRSPDQPFFSYITAISQWSYQRSAEGGYLHQSLPPVEFAYSRAEIQEAVREIDADSLENLPYGLDGVNYQWADLDGEGLPGILTEQAGDWYYKRNLGDGRFGPLQTVLTRPSLARLSGGQQQLLDLAGDGQLDLVGFEGGTPGFYERTTDRDWAPFQSFSSLPNIAWSQPNLRFIDLNGDGHADALLTEEQGFTWYPSLAEAGFGPARYLSRPPDEELGPRLLFADETQSVYLADMCGDGLTDLVRIRNGAVCYWPNLGYGRFGTKVTMDHAPESPLLFDHDDQFDHRRIRLADIDGSGTTDILYLHRDGVLIYFNESGNRWSVPRRLSQFPPIDNLATVTTSDLLGNGTACLIWSSPLGNDNRRSMRYIDLMGSQKPHLLVSIRNNLGAETSITYVPSTRFYLNDKQAGQPWLTSLPFPVHVVEQVTVKDVWRQTVFTTGYSYHHGYFDGQEREFRGFGRVEQMDSQDFGAFSEGNTASPYITDDKRLYQPPVKTVTWFHTGALIKNTRIWNPYQREYFPNRLAASRPDGGNVFGDFSENDVADPQFAAPDLIADEWRDALRACKGQLLRQETYELDVDALANGIQKPVRLFSASTHHCHIRRVQRQAGNPHAVFLVTESEVVTYQYELDLRPEQLAPDPRISHKINLGIDEYGNIRQAVNVVYLRQSRFVDPTLPEGVEALIRNIQSEAHLVYTEVHFTNDVFPQRNAEPGRVPEPDNYRLRLPYEVLTYELTGIKTQDDSDRQTTDKVVDDRYFTLDELLAFRLSTTYQSSGLAVGEIAYHVRPEGGVPQKRLVEHSRTLFFDTTLEKSLPLGRLNALALPFENYTLALSDELLEVVFREKLTAPVQSALSDRTVSGYLSGNELVSRFGEDMPGRYWLCAGVIGFAPEAARHFFLPERYADPFGQVTNLEFDPLDLFLVSSTDAVGNRTEVMAFDYRLLAPRRIKDANDNLSELRFDILGMPTALALMGKGEEADSLGEPDQAWLNPDFETRLDFFVTSDYQPAQARRLLRGATARHLYYLGDTEETLPDGRTVRLWGQHPPCACEIVRTRHLADDPDSPLQVTFEYSDGMGNVLVKKMQAEPEPGGTVLRWVDSGKTVLNNKGNPVKQYEPSFSPPTLGHRFGRTEEAGVTPILYYDAVGRVIRTEAPDGSYSRVLFSPWHVGRFDQNDTVTEAGNAWFNRKQTSASADDRRAARLAAEHADTPTMTILDSLGREVILIEHNRSGPANALTDEKYVTFTKLDAEGNPLWVQDQRGNRIVQCLLPVLPDGRRPFNDPANLDPPAFTPGYDMAGNLLFRHSPDAGDRWLLNDAAGKPMFAWNNRAFVTRVTYDRLHRPVGSFVMSLNPLDATPEIQFGKMVYGEGRDDDSQRNLRGRLYQHFDSAGVVTMETYDFKGNPLRTSRRLSADYKSVPDWSQETALEEDRFVSATRYDARNRSVQFIASHRAEDNPVRFQITQSAYNEAGLLTGVAVWLHQSAEPTGLLDPGAADQPVLKGLKYNAKGQRILLQYGNGASTRYDYEPDTFRLQRIRTTRGGDSAVLQDLNYTYDPVGNIVRVRDEAEDRVFHSNQCATPGAAYRYDALYRLVAASGRGHKGNGQPYDSNDRLRQATTLPNDCQALQNYVETYRYDAVGNILQMRHHAGRDPDQPGQALWNRRYQYALTGNRLLATSLPGDSDGLPDYVAVPGYGARYTYDLNGNLKSTPHLPSMEWDFRDQLRATAQQVVHDGTPETTYYVYDASGRRVRKVTETGAGARSKERIYLGGFEIYREYSGGGVALERETLHVMDDNQRVALVETQTIANRSRVASLRPVVRYQLSNHQDSVSLELDENAAVIAYEEYTPYGGTAYCAGRSAAEVSLKRFRYTGKERDEESGFHYHGARYYIAWLGRWASCDPAGMIDSTNLYLYVAANPVKHVDPTGGGLFDKVKQAVADGANRVQAAVKPGGAVFEAVDSAFKPNEHPVAAAVLNNMANRGQGMVEGAQKELKQTAEDYADIAYHATHSSEPNSKAHLKQALQRRADAPLKNAVGMATGFAGQLKTVGEGLGDVAYYTGVTPMGKVLPSHMDEAGADAKVANAMTDIVLDGPQIVLAVDGAATMAEGALGAAGKAPLGGGKSPAQSPVIHKNSLTSNAANHVYEIHDTALPPGRPYKTGISGQPLYKNGTSPRAALQVNELNRLNPVAPGQPPRFSQQVIATNVPRKAALSMEQHAVNAHQNTFGSPPPGNVFPKPNQQYGPGAYVSKKR